MRSVLAFICLSAAGGILSAQDIATATVYFYRVKTTFDSSFNPTVVIDGHEIALLEKNQMFGVRLPPGRHQLTMIGRLANRVPFDFTVEAGRVYYARYLHAKEQPSAAEVALQGAAAGVIGSYSQSVVLTEERRVREDAKKLKPAKESAIKNHEMAFIPSAEILRLQSK